MSAVVSAVDKSLQAAPAGKCLSGLKICAAGVSRAILQRCFWMGKQYE